MASVRTPASRAGSASAARSSTVPAARPSLLLLAASARATRTTGSSILPACCAIRASAAARTAVRRAGGVVATASSHPRHAGAGLGAPGVAVLVASAAAARASRKSRSPRRRRESSSSEALYRARSASSARRRPLAFAAAFSASAVMARMRNTGSAAGLAASGASTASASACRPIRAKPRPQHASARMRALPDSAPRMAARREAALSMIAGASVSGSAPDQPARTAAQARINGIRCASSTESSRFASSGVAVPAAIAARAERSAARVHVSASRNSAVQRSRCSGVGMPTMVATPQPSMARPSVMASSAASASHAAQRGSSDSRRGARTRSRRVHAAVAAAAVVNGRRASVRATSVAAVRASMPSGAGACATSAATVITMAITAHSPPRWRVAQTQRFGNLQPRRRLALPRQSPKEHCRRVQSPREIRAETCHLGAHCHAIRMPMSRAIRRG